MPSLKTDSDHDRIVRDMQEHARQLGHGQALARLVRRWARVGERILDAFVEVHPAEDCRCAFCKESEAPQWKTVEDAFGLKVNARVYAERIEAVTSYRGDRDAMPTVSEELRKLADEFEQLPEPIPA